MTERTVLISGAGIAGPTLAYWLARHGFRPTVVERSGSVRSSGSPVDVRRQALEVAARMGVLEHIRDARTQAVGLSFVDADGGRVGRIPMRALQGGHDDIEVPRGDLASILYEASRHEAEFLFDDSVAALDQDEHGVDVTFDRAAPRRFDLVVGADGLHSATRRLVFGADSEFVRHQGMYIATVPLPGPADLGREVVMHNSPGKAVAIHPSRGGALAAFFFRSPVIPGFDHRDTPQHKRLLAEAFTEVSWRRLPDLLDVVAAGDDLYFDSVSQVRLKRWSRGRVTLLGDAASCVSLFGDGSTSAMAGAFTLAAELAEAGGHEQAFRRYETAHRRLVDPRQRNVGLAAALLVPSSRGGIHFRNRAVRVWSAVDRLRDRRALPAQDLSSRG